MPKQTAITEPGETDAGQQDVPAFNSVSDALDAVDLSSLLQTEGFLGSQDDDAAEGATPETAPPNTDTPAAADATEDDPNPDDPEAETPAEDDEEEEEERAELPPEIQERINKRIGKEVAKRKAAETQAQESVSRVEELEAELEQARQTAPQPPNPSAGPLADVNSVQELRNRETQATQLNDWADEQLMRLRRNPERVAELLRQNQVKLPHTDGEDEYSPEAMEEFLIDVRRKATQTLRSIPERQQYLQAVTANETKAVELFPWWKQPKSAEYKEAMAVVGTLPEIKRLPHWKIASGIFVLGLKAMKAQQVKTSANGKIRQTMAPPPAPTTTRRSAPSGDPKTAKSSKARERFDQNGDEESLTELVAAEL